VPCFPENGQCISRILALHGFVHIASPTGGRGVDAGNPVQCGTTAARGGTPHVRGQHNGRVDHVNKPVNKNLHKNLQFVPKKMQQLKKSTEIRDQTVVLASTTEPSRTRESRMRDQPCLSRRKATQVTFGPSIDSRNATEGARQLTSTEDSCSSSSRSGVASIGHKVSSAANLKPCRPIPHSR